MPIPTRTSPVKPNSRSGVTSRLSTEASINTSKPVGPQNGKIQGPQTSRALSNTKSSAAQSHIQPRPAVRTTSSTLRQVHSPSTTVRSSKIAPDSATTSSRASSASSNNVSRSGGSGSVRSATQPKSTTSTAAPSGNRTVSAGTARSTTSKALPSRSLGSKATSKSAIPSVTRTLRAPKETTSSTRTTTTTTTTTAAPRTKVPTSTTRADTRTEISKSTTNTATTPSSTTRLHDELYQLQLLHLAAPSTLHQYRASITHTLDRKKSDLVARQDSLLRLEAQIQESQSINALDQWLQHMLTLDPHPHPHPHRPNHHQSDLSPADSNAIAYNTPIQHLSTLIADLSSLTSPHTDDLSPLTQFETWLASATSIRDDRAHHHHHHQSPGPSHSDELLFIRPLDQDWTARMRALQTRLSVLVVGFRALIPPSPDSTSTSFSSVANTATPISSTTTNSSNLELKSGIATVLLKHHDLAVALLSEVDAAMVIERAVLRDEEAWEKKELELALRELSHDHGPSAQREAYTGIWNAG